MRERGGCAPPPNENPAYATAYVPVFLIEWLFITFITYHCRQNFNVAWIKDHCTVRVCIQETFLHFPRNNSDACCTPYSSVTVMTINAPGIKSTEYLGSGIVRDSRPSGLLLGILRVIRDIGRLLFLVVHRINSG